MWRIPAIRLICLILPVATWMSAAQASPVGTFFVEACLKKLPDTNKMAHHPALADAQIERRGELCEQSRDPQSSFKNWALDHVFGFPTNFIVGTRSVYRSETRWREDRPYKLGRDDTPGVIVHCGVLVNGGDPIELARELTTASGVNWDQPDARRLQHSEYRLWRLDTPDGQRFLEIAIRDASYGAPGAKLLYATLMHGLPTRLECPSANRYPQYVHDQTNEITSGS